MYRTNDMLTLAARKTSSKPTRSTPHTAPTAIPISYPTVRLEP